MLRPTKDTDLRTAPIIIDAFILRLLQAQGRASFAEVHTTVAQACGEIDPRRIHEALLLLYALGLLDYVEELDTFVPTPRPATAGGAPVPVGSGSPGRS